MSLMSTIQVVTIHVLKHLCTCTCQWCHLQSLLPLLPLLRLLLLQCLQAELDLYFKSGQLVKFLQAWKGTSDSLTGRYEELMVEMYERGYIGEQVCDSLQLMPCIIRV
jgi:hypothetical protein